MDTLLAWLQSPTFIVIAGFHVFIIFMLVLDLGVFQRKAHAVSMKEAGAWSAVWVALAFLFAYLISQYWHLWDPEQPDAGGEKSIEFITGYLIEKSLSVDNLFVFLVIFRYFAVPAHLQHRVLYWGIVGAVLMRALLILVGAALLQQFHWMIYIFGGFLIYTAYKLMTAAEGDIDPGKNIVLRIARRFYPVVHDYDSPHFWVKREGRWHLTPLPLVLLVVESTDVVFALDSIPAIFAVTQDTFIVYTSNIFAILGLRALFFLLANFLGMFRYLSVGLGLVLGFVGLKMILEPHIAEPLAAYGIGKQGLIVISLGVVTSILVISVIASIIAGPKELLEHPPQAVIDVSNPEGAAHGEGDVPGVAGLPSRETDQVRKEDQHPRE